MTKLAKITKKIKIILSLNSIMANWTKKVRLIRIKSRFLQNNVKQTPLKITIIQIRTIYRKNLPKKVKTFSRKQL